jgi:hypothetical protein
MRAAFRSLFVFCMTMTAAICRLCRPRGIILTDPFLRVSRCSVGDDVAEQSQSCLGWDGSWANKAWDKGWKLIVRPIRLLHVVRTPEMTSSHLFDPEVSLQTCTGSIPRWSYRSTIRSANNFKLPSRAITHSTRGAVEVSMGSLISISMGDYCAGISLPSRKRANTPPKQHVQHSEPWLVHCMTYCIVGCGVCRKVGVIGVGGVNGHCSQYFFPNNVKI